MQVFFRCYQTKKINHLHYFTSGLLLQASKSIITWQLICGRCHKKSPASCVSEHWTVKLTRGRPLELHELSSASATQRSQMLWIQQSDCVSVLMVIAISHYLLIAVLSICGAMMSSQQLQCKCMATSILCMQFCCEAPEMFYGFTNCSVHLQESMQIVI